MATICAAVRLRRIRRFAKLWSTTPIAVVTSLESVTDFQVLTETGVLPGALLRNAGLKYICRSVDLKVTTADSVFTEGYGAGDVISVPIAHHDGNYFADAETIAKLQGEDRVAFSYSDNPNGSIGDIAGILSQNRRVLGMMPHPERAADEAHGGTDGVAVFRALTGIVATA